MQIKTPSILFYIVIHNIELINFFEREQKYLKLRDYKYLLVGNHEKDYSTEKIIQCNKLRDNIETFNNYLAYTGWYAVSKLDHNYDYVCLFEYDSDITDSFSYSSLVSQITEKKNEIYGFNSLNINNSFLNNDVFSNKLIEFLKRKNIREVKTNNNKWIVTNNAIFSSKSLRDMFVDELTVELLSYLDNDKMSGHFLERFLSVFCFLKQKEFGFIDGEMIKHRALDSHNTQNRKFSDEGYERFKAANKISD